MKQSVQNKAKVYNEAEERRNFEGTRNAHTVRKNEVGDYVLPSTQDAWVRWSECAKYYSLKGAI